MKAVRGFLMILLPLLGLFIFFSSSLKVFFVFAFGVVCKGAFNLLKLYFNTRCSTFSYSFYLCLTLETSPNCSLSTMNF